MIVPGKTLEVKTERIKMSGDWVYPFPVLILVRDNKEPKTSFEKENAVETFDVKLAEELAGKLY